MIVAAGVDILELAGLVIRALGVGALKQEAFNLVGGVERVVFLLMERVGIALEDTSDIGAVRRTILVNDVAEDQNFAAAEDVSRGPVEGSPIHAEAKIAFALSGKATD